MGGGEKTKANQMADSQYSKENQANAAFTAQQADERTGARGRADDMYSSMAAGYKDLAGQKISMADFGGGYQAGGGGGAPATLQATTVTAPKYTRDANYQTAADDYRNFATTGGIDADAMRKGEGTMTDFMNTGGVDARRQASIEDTIANMKEFGRTGGLTDADMQRMQGNGGFDEFAKTGGLSDADRANIRSRATSVIPATMATANAQADRARSVQGGYGPGTAALKSRLLRSANADNSAAARDAELGIMSQVNAGRQYGISGMADSAQKAQGLRTGNMMSGMSGAATADSDLMHAIQSGKMWGADSISGVENNIQSLTQAGKMYGTTGTMGIANSGQTFADKQVEADIAAKNANEKSRVDTANANAQAQASAAGSAASSAASAQNQNIGLQQYIDEYNRQNQMAGLQGMGGLYTSTPGEISMYDQNNLANRGMSNSSQNQLIGQKLAGNPSALQSLGGIIGGAGALAGGAAGITTGLSSIGNVIKPKGVVG